MIKKILKSIFSSLGFEISRIRGAEQPIKQLSYFEFEESCQVPYLSEIYDFVFGRDLMGTVVEIGAFDGHTYSNSIGLIKRGWNGLFAEPVPEFFRQCEELHGSNPRVKLVQTAISDFKGVSRISLAGPLSTIDHATRREYKFLDWSKDFFNGQEIEVPTQTLDEFLRNNGIGSGFEVLIVDVEGSEEKVFSNFDIAVWRPILVIVELADFHPFLTSAKSIHWKLGNSILESGYGIIYKDAINTIFGRKDYLANLFE